MLFKPVGIAAAFIGSLSCVQAGYSSGGPNVFYYWGQNSAGGGSTQASLATYCNSGQADALILSFLNIFNVGGDPGLNLAGACETTFSGTNLLNCPDIGKDIESCQSKGVKIILSLGGAAGSYGFNSDSQAQTFASTLWNLFGGGSATNRPFGDAQIDGVDLDIEGGGSTGYATLVTSLRSKFGSSFLIGAAPQCPFPDVILGSVIDAVSFDYVNVQFYNNYCSAAGGSFNFDTWANWAQSTSPNKNVKVMFTIPGSTTAAGTGYAPISTIQSIVPQLASRYPGTFGGVSVWDASQAWNNGNFASTLYSTVKSGGNGNGGGGDNQPGQTTTRLPTTTSATKTATSVGLPTATSSCASSGQSCSNNGQFVCTSGGGYAVCDHSKWTVGSCPSGTTCIPTAEGNSVYCGYANGSNACSAVSSIQRLHITFNSKNSVIPKPYKASQVYAQLTVADATTKEFEVVLNARRTNPTPFKKSITVEFNTPSNIKFTDVSSGTIRQVGNSVRIQAQNAYNTSMTFVLTLKGSVQSGVFVAPNPASVRFK
ncbi:Chitinase 1 [Rhizopus stolonifer]|uniref:chitinase n=1 Tax=Rhizopus stolonifer TaxID=4846 RepID=A0A367J7T9_RHIST|nr:Chitinase 1 [Rhizopus stolonifer]